MALNVEKCQEFLKKSDALITDLSKVSGQLKDPSKYEEITASIKQIVKHTFGLPSEIKFFGSRVIGVALEQSDLDIFIEIDHRSFPFYVKSNDHSNKFKRLASALTEDSKWLMKRSAADTAIPVIFSAYNPMELDCDINISNEVGTGTSKILAHLFEIQPEAVSLFHFIRMWLKTQGYAFLKGYSITLLVVFYMQQKDFMPTVENVQSGVPKKTSEGKDDFKIENSNF